MKIYIVVIFSVINLILSEKLHYKNQKKRTIPQLSGKCKNMKCFANEEPECLKLKHKLLPNRSFYINTINKCEMEYLKCLDDFEATVVLMKYCAHKSLVGSTEIARSNTTSKGSSYTKDHRRNKKQVRVKRAYEDGYGGHRIKEVSLMNTSHAFNFYKDTEDILSDSNERAKTYHQVAAEDSASDMVLYSDERRHKLSKVYESAEPDAKEYEADCPTVCPSRAVMVCAKCEHGVYKTFVSVCHMRMFACKHKDDSLELISRYPCVLSAPYIAEQEMQPRGQVQEPGDQDLVLKYIICRDKEKLGGAAKIKGDPRCNFEYTEKANQTENVPAPYDSTESEY